jgi:hypothetical protein
VSDVDVRCGVQLAALDAIASMNFWIFPVGVTGRASTMNQLVYAGRTRGERSLCDVVIARRGLRYRFGLPVRPIRTAITSGPRLVRVRADVEWRSGDTDKRHWSRKRFSELSP